MITSRRSVRREFQNKRAGQGIQFAQTKLWADRRAEGAPLGRQVPRTVHKLWVTILKSTQVKLFKEIPEDWHSHPEEDKETKGASGLGKEEAKCACRRLPIRHKTRCSGVGLGIIPGPVRSSATHQGSLLDTVSLLAYPKNLS